MPASVTICANLLKSAWMTFVLLFPIIIPCLLERMVIYFKVYAKLEDVFLKRLIFFSTVAESI